MKRANGICISAIKHVASIPADIDQADFKEHAEMLGDGRLGQAEAGSNIADGAFLCSKKSEDVAAARFSDGVERIGGGRGARHEGIIFPYRNMSRGILRPAQGCPEDSSLRLEGQVVRARAG